MTKIRLICMSLSVVLSACSTCDDSADSWRFGESPGAPDATLETDTGVDEPAPREPVLQETWQTAMGCCDDLYYYFETKEPRCFEVRLRWAPEEYGFDVYPDVTFVPEDPFVSLDVIRVYDDRCEPAELEGGAPVEEVRGAVEVETSAVAAELDLEVRLEGEGSFRPLQTERR